VGAFAEEKRGELHEITAQKVKGKSGCTERRAKSGTSKPAIREPPVQFSGPSSLQRGSNWRSFRGELFVK